MRRAHYLKSNKSGKIPDNILVFDTETREVKRDGEDIHHALWFGWCAYARRLTGGRWTKPKYVRFTTEAEFYTLLLDRSRGHHTLTLYAHNLGYDLAATGLLECLEREGWKLTMCVLESPPTFLTWKRGRSTIRALDTLNFFPMSLKTLGQSVGIEKIPMPNIDQPQAVWDVYGRRDTEVLYAAVQSWYALLQEWDLGCAGPTLPSQTMRAFRHRFMTHKILIDAHPVALDIARKSYYGGRVECFAIGEYHGSFHKLDINSMYPFVMHERDYPTTLRSVWTRVGLDVLLRLLESYSVCARVSLRTDEAPYPYRTNARLLFPSGRFETCLSSPELRYALDHNHIEEVHVAVIYERAPLFVDYVDFFYQKRQEAKAAGNEMMNLMCKLFLNSFYGKFGQLGRVFKNVHTTEESAYKVWFEIDAETKRKYYYRQIGTLVQTVEGEVEGAESHPAIAAHITAEARTYLWSLISLAGLDHVYYVDTDSLILDDIGLHNLCPLVNPDKLGLLKSEGQAQTIVLTGPKHYQFGTEHKQKGVRKDAEWIDSETLRQLHFRSLKALLARGDISHPQMNYVTKHFDYTYKKGHVLPSGRTAPYNLPADLPAL